MNSEEFLAAAREEIEFLKGVSPADYWKSTLPSVVDYRIVEICDLYIEASPVQRQMFLSDLDQTAYFNLGAFTTRMAMQSVRMKSEDILLKGLVAVVIRLEWPDADRREGIMDIAVLYHSALKLGSPDHLFQKATQYATEEVTERLILGYLDRSPEDQSLEVMGWKEVEGPSGLIYQFGNEPIPEGFL